MFTPVRILSDNGPVRVELARWQDRLVVVKKLRADAPFLFDRLKREAEVLRKLEHDNIVPLLLAEGNVLVYAYCPGVNLAEALEAGPLPVKRALRIILDVLKGLVYAHQNGVIHFDVKPANIIVRGEHALLADFGFAKDLALTAITSEDILLGTPNYMAPEQFRGERNDPRSDLYSVGAVLYHMLTGQPPYGGQIIRFLIGDRQAQLEPLPESAKSIAELVYRSLAFLPENRFHSAEEMLQSYSQALSG
jgi:serine/threonine-protein kinase